MCGITGFLWPGADPEQHQEAIERTTETLLHRGPDDRGVWLDADAGVALGHRRLSILDLSPLGHQPMASACGRYVMVYNGEVYNFRSLRAQLEASGHRFRGGSDTEVMLAAFSAWGVGGALERFNGMFAFALWDRAERELHLVRDRLGEKPLYYGWCGRAFLFGSELKSLRAHPQFRAETDRGALALYMRYGYIPAPYSIYRGIRKLPAGGWLRIRPEEVGADPAVTRYWSVREVAQGAAGDRFAASEAELTTQLDELLRDAVRIRMEADVPLGAFLSGGVDSSTVVALMQAQSDRPVKTFTIGFQEEGYNEAEHAALVARHLGTEHTELYVTPGEALALVPRIPALYDEPFADPSQIPTALVAQLARGHVTVALSGDGGDELFGGYNRHLWAPRMWRRMRRVPLPLRSSAAAILKSVPPTAWDGMTRALSPVLPRGLLHNNAGDKVQKLAGALSATDQRGVYASLISHWDWDVVKGGERSDPLLQDALWPRLPSFTEQVMYLDTIQYLPDDILVKVDRATMSVSLEGRVPLLDPRVVEFAWRLPLEMKVREGRGKHLLRQVLYRYVPPALIERPKSGFAMPIDSWLRGPLREWAEHLLDPRALADAGVLRVEPVRERWRQHLNGSRNWQYELWDVLMFQAWREAADRAPRPSPRAAVALG
jgi:asparagine synthase (glutamine-hydrolysing)